MAKLKRAVALRNLESVERRFALAATRTAPLRHVLVEYPETSTAPSYEDTESLGAALRWPTGVRRPGFAKSGGKRIVMIDILLPNLSYKHFFRPGMRCSSWIPTPVTQRVYTGVSEEIDPDELVQTTAQLEPVTTAATEALVSLLPICGLPKTDDDAHYLEFWLHAVHELTGTKPSQKLRNGMAVRVIDDICLASELAINKILESSDDRPPAKLCENLTETELELLLYLWTHNVATFDEIAAAVWNDKPVQSGTIAKRLRELRDKLYGSGHNLTITGTNAIFSRMDE